VNISLRVYREGIPPGGIHLLLVFVGASLDEFESVKIRIKLFERSGKVGG
jgi:hypothetical protein